MFFQYRMVCIVYFKMIKIRGKFSNCFPRQHDDLYPLYDKRLLSCIERYKDVTKSTVEVGPI